MHVKSILLAALALSPALFGRGLDPDQPDQVPATPITVFQAQSNQPSPQADSPFHDRVQLGLPADTSQVTLAISAGVSFQRTEPGGSHGAESVVSVWSADDERQPYTVRAATNPATLAFLRQGRSEVYRTLELAIENGRLAVTWAHEVQGDGQASARVQIIAYRTGGQAR